MTAIQRLIKTAGRARYAAAQGIRSAWYGGQYLLARQRSAGFNRPGEPAFQPNKKPDLKALRRAYFDLFRRDRANIEAGLYPDPVARELNPAKMVSTVRRARAFFADIPDVDRRRVSRDGTEIRRRQPTDLSRYPAYYRQNFHYQTDGWLSEQSAYIYDHQVEALFTGSAAAMRRAALAELAKDIRAHGQKGYRLVDLACGSGSFLSELMTAYPRLEAQGVDLSPAYVATARRALRHWPQVEVIEANAESLPFSDGTIDGLVSIYLFHELPIKIREKIIYEAARIIRPGGCFVVADSLQFGDNERLDGILEYFPEGFHEPYYKEYLGWDFEPAMMRAGFELETHTLAFLTKVRVWRRVG